MRTPLSIRPVPADDQQTLQAGRRSSHALLWRRCQILLARARGQTARVSAAALGCDAQPVRQAMWAFNTQGLAALPPRSSAPRRTPRAAVDPTRRELLRALLPQSPRRLGQPTSLGTLPLAAEVAAAAGITSRPVSGDTIRRALARLGVRWKRAQPWITSPDPAYARKQTSGIA
jgi:hypothetical protein